MFIARNTIQHERVLLRPEPPGLGAGSNELAPELNGLLIRHQLPAAGILKKYLADGAVGFQAAEHVPAGAMKKIRYRPQYFPLGPFTGAGRAEKQHCSIDHGASLCFNWI